MTSLPPGWTQDRLHGYGCLCHSPVFAQVNAILERKFSRRAVLTGAVATAALALMPRGVAAAIPEAPARPVAFTNIRLFDGRNPALRDGRRVVVEGRRIAGLQPAGDPLPEGVTVIDGGGRTLMPGLIDAHWHSMMAALTLSDMFTADLAYINLVAAEEAGRTLMRGFTTVRDLAGPSFGLKRAIDSGVVAGPRIFPCGAMISQTSGHGDFRLPHEVPAPLNAPLSHGEAYGGGAIAEGVDQVLKRAREQLMLGASR